jgi:adenine-specific DNA-methyltransferase
MTIEKLNATTPDLTKQNIERLAELFPECVTEGPEPTASDHGEPVIDFDLLRQALTDHVIEGPQERFRLVWPGKRQALLTANAAIDKTLRPVRDESVDFDTTRNLFIEGDNLDALKLLQETYLGKVKMIYIDPPYNTGKDFIYKDKFARTREEYEADSGQRDEGGGRLVANPETNGRFHSDWLSMMYPRLKLARNFLAEDGVLFVSCDDREEAGLRAILDEIFGHKNRLDRGAAIWPNRGSTKGFRSLVKNHEYILAYARDTDRAESLYHCNFETEGDIRERLQIKRSPRNPLATVEFPAGLRIDGEPDAEIHGPISPGTNQIDIVDGPMCFKDGKLAAPIRLQAAFPYKNQMIEFFSKLGTNEETLDTKGQKWKEVYFNSNGVPYFVKERAYKPMSSIIDDVPNSSADEMESLEMAGWFDQPKPSPLIRHLVSFFTTGDHVVFDFFAGSSTTAHAVLSQNALDGHSRTFIMVQLPEEIGEERETHQHGIVTVSELSRERIRRAGNKILKENPELQGKLDTGFRAFRIDTGNLIDTRSTPKETSQGALAGTISHIKDDRSDEDLLFGALLRWGVDITLQIEKRELAGRTVWLVDPPAEGEEGAALIACFAQPQQGKGGIDTEVADAIARLKPLRALFRDDGFATDAVMENVQSRFKQLAPDTDVKVL